MTAPAVPISVDRPFRRGARAGIDRVGLLVETWLRAHTLVVYAFLYLPIVVVVALVVVAALAFVVSTRRSRITRDPRTELARDLAGVETKKSDRPASSFIGLLSGRRPVTT